MREWVLMRWQVYARVSLILAVFIPPVIFDRRTVDVFNLLKLTVLWAAGLSAVALWIAWSAERREWMPVPKLSYATAAFLVAAALATIFSENPALSVTGLYHRYGGLVPFMLYAALAGAMVGLYWERPEDLKEIARASAFASLLLTAYVLIQAAGKDWIEWRDASGGPPEFPVGTMGNSNFAGGYLGIAVPFLVYVAVTAKSEVTRAILAAVVGLDLLALWFTQTRGGMFAAAAGLAVMAWFYRDRVPRWVRLSAASLAVLGVALVVIIAANVGGTRERGPLTKIETLRTGTFVIRTYYWGTAFRIFADSPLIGTGLETYYANYPKYRLPEDGRQLGLTITDKPHNIYLEYASNSGLLGVGTYLVVVGWGVWMAARGISGFQGPKKLLLVTFLAVLVGYLAQGVFSIDVPPLAVMGWLGLGGVAALSDPAVIAARLRREERPEPRASSKKKKKSSSRSSEMKDHPTRWIVHVAALVITLIAVWVGTKPVLADAKAKSGQTAQTTGAPGALEFYEAAIELHPFEPSYRTLAGSIWEAQALDDSSPALKLAHLQQALSHYTAAYELQRGNVFYMMNIARVYATLGEQVDPSKFKEADRWWMRAANHDPTDWDVQNRYALMLNSWANASAGDPALRRRTVAQLEKVVKIRSDFVPAWINLGKVYRALGENARAVSALQRAIDIDPRNSEAQDLLAALQA